MAIRSTDNWQAGKNVLGCNEYMFKNQLYCDVIFIVGTAGKEVKAHKYVLASRSSVFAAMLYGSLPEANAVIIPDIEPDVFDTLLRFMYFEAKEMNEHSVIGTLYAADKYDVTDLVEICRSFLESNIKEDTVCVIMENAKMFNMADLYSKCKTFIFNCSDTTVFDSPGFLDLGKECLKGIIESDDLPLDETLIYQSLIRWARHHCEREHLDKSDPKQLRSMLGDLLYEIRFPAMSLEVFWKHVVIDEVLMMKKSRFPSKYLEDM